MGNCSETLCPLYSCLLQVKYFTYVELKKISTFCLISDAEITDCLSHLYFQ